MGFGYRIFYRHSLWDNDKDGVVDGFIVGTETKGIPFFKNVYKTISRDSEGFVPYNFGE